ncbi:MAG: hypothetical protein J1F36_05720 [Clostridiales bacterium]|nr:hypothetical protein [Clostridiales bacterium]
MSEYKKLSLSSACNHKLIYGKQDQTNDKVGIEGTYIAESDMKIKTNDIVDGVPFDIECGNFDNIECDGQQIPVGFSAEKLHIIGFSLWCNIYSVIKIVYSNGEVHSVKVPFIDFEHTYELNWFDMASVRGDIISHGVIASGKQNNPVFLHHISVDIPCLSEIKEIILPENFCLHIFAITFETAFTSKEGRK